MPALTSEPRSPTTVRFPVEVVIPLRWDRPLSEQRADVEEMGAYLVSLHAVADVTVVDGSRPELLAAHRAAWPDGIRVMTPDGRLGVNGKVVGALSGIAASRHELVVLADDDVRYDGDSLTTMYLALQEADMVRPQNVFTEWPWHARWDFCRTLIARAFAADWPGTFGLRASAVAVMGGWSAEVLFENLEMVRTAQANGRLVVNLPGLLVGRRPPPAAHFWSQRVRQAYDDLAQPGRLAVELSIVPLVAVSAIRRPGLLVAMAAATVVLAEVGRRRSGGLDIPRSVPLWARPGSWSEGCASGSPSEPGPVVAFATEVGGSAWQPTRSRASRDPLRRPLPLVGAMIGQKMPVPSPLLHDWSRHLLGVPPDAAPATWPPRDIEAEQPQQCGF